MTRQDGPDEPLDPALEKVRRKMIRLLAVSIAVLMVGLIAVLSAVVYRAKQGDETVAAGVPAVPAEAAIAVAPGSRVTAVTGLARDRALLVLDRPDGTQELVVFEPASGALVSRTSLVPSASPQSPAP